MKYKPTTRYRRCSECYHDPADPCPKACTAHNRARIRREGVDLGRDCRVDPACPHWINSACRHAGGCWKIKKK